MLRTVLHPTRAALLVTARSLVEIHGVDNVTVEMVLSLSKVSKASLYHHFVDFDALLDEVEMGSFAEFVDEAISISGQAFGKASSPEEFRSHLHAVIVLAHDPARAARRIERARVVGSSGTSLDFIQALAREQERLRQRGQDLIAEAQSRGWVSTTSSARALSSFILGFSFGRVLDDVCDDKADPAEWNAIVHLFLDRVLLA